MSWSPIDRDWRREAIIQIISMCERTWDKSYDTSLIEIASFAAARIEGAMSRGGNVRWADCRVDCLISFERVPLSRINIINPERVERALRGYPALRESLTRNPRQDSVPIVCGRQGPNMAVWDGHHRLRTYELAGRTDIPAIVAEIVTGTGLVRLANSRRDASQGPVSDGGLG